MFRPLTCVPEPQHDHKYDLNEYKQMLYNKDYKAAKTGPLSNQKLDDKILSLTFLVNSTAFFLIYCINTNWHLYVFAT